MTSIMIEHIICKWNVVIPQSNYLRELVSYRYFIYLVVCIVSLLPFGRCCVHAWHLFNAWRPRQNYRHLADDIFKCIFLNENVWILNKVSLKLVPKCPIDNIPSLVQIIAWCRLGNKPLSEPMMVILPTQIGVTRHYWVKAKFGNAGVWCWWNMTLRMLVKASFATCLTPYFIHFILLLLL